MKHFFMKHVFTKHNIFTKRIFARRNFKCNFTKRNFAKRIFTVFALSCLLCGCSAESPLPVSAAAFTRTAKGYEMTAELIRQDSLDGEAEPVYLTAAGDSLPAVFENAERRLGGHFYFSHAETIIVDAALAKEGISELSDFLCEHPDARLTLRLVVARGASAKDLLQLDALGGSIPGVALYEILQGLVQRGDIPDLPLYQVQNALRNGERFLLPCLREAEDEHAAVEGFAVIEQGALAGFLNGEEDA